MMYYQPDRIVRETLSDVGEAIPFFQSTLPVEIVKMLDFSTLRVEPSTFIDENLKEYRADLLFQVMTTDKKPAQIYILFEHKSYKDPKIFTQMLSYLARIYEQQTESSIVIPFLFYHGKKKWNLGFDFASRFKLTEKQKALLQRYLPNFELAHFILSNESIDKMNFSVYSKTLFKIMRSIAYGDLSTELSEIIDLKSIYQSGEKGLVKFRNLLKYAYTRGNLTAEQVTQVISNISAETEEGEMTTIRELMKQEYKQGKQEGMEQGIEQGGLLKAKELLIKQIERRFGRLSENERETVLNCKNQDRLESASIAFAENKTKEEVLAQLI